MPVSNLASVAKCVPAPASFGCNSFSRDGDDIPGLKYQICLSPQLCYQRQTNSSQYQDFLSIYADSLKVETRVFHLRPKQESNYLLQPDNRKNGLGQHKIYE